MGKRIEYNCGELIGDAVFKRRLPTVKKNGRYRSRAIFECQYCDDKVEFEADITAVKMREIRSCGCLQRVMAANRQRKHGVYYTKAYKTWWGMKKRCYNKKSPDYRLYGGRGIKICPEWLNDVKVFYDYVSPLPHYKEDGYSIDRIDNDGDYEPGNVRWADSLTQASNKTFNTENESGYIGVYISKSGNYVAGISHNRKLYWLGTYKDPKDAAKARNSFAIKHNLPHNRLINLQ